MCRLCEKADGDDYTVYGVCFECIQRLINEELEDRARSKRFVVIYDKEVLRKKP
jgi:hypothetical protein